MSLTRRALLAAAAALTLSTPALAQATAWPTEPVHLYVGFPAGSSPDTLARLVAEPLTARLGQPVVVENKPGAGGVIGVQQMLTGKKDYAFGVTINGPLTTASRTVPDLNYDVARDIVPVALIATAPLVLAVNADNPAKTVADFVADAKAHPGEVTYGSVGNGSGAHLTAELFAADAGVELLHIPFTSYAEVTTSIVGNEIQSGFMAPSAALPQVEAGKLRLLGVTSAQPFAQIPDVPVMAGQGGLPADFRAELWDGFIAPTGTDPAVVTRLNAELDAILKDEDVRQKMLAIGWQAAGGAPDALAQRITDDTALWGGVLDRIGTQK